VFIGFLPQPMCGSSFGKFEWWFKQCDESILNRGAQARRFWQQAIKEGGAAEVLKRWHNCGFPATLLNN
jgi:hypothetical protein